MPEHFTQEEQEILKRFVTNTDKDVFALINMPEVIKGALFSRYSRSPKSLRRLLLDEFIKDREAGFTEIVGFQVSTGAQIAAAVKKAEDFYDRILDGYGDDSVGELGGAHLAFENVSNYAAKILEDGRIGGSPLEKSTRYVFFDAKADGDYLFFREPVITASRFSDEYLGVNRLLFDTYVKWFEPMKKFIEERYPMESFEFRTERGEEVRYTDIKDDAMRKRAGAAYRSSVKAQACDILRYLLPASTLTNVGMYGNGRFFQGLLTKMYTCPLTEIKSIAAAAQEELNKVIPAFVRRAKCDEYLSATEQTAASVAKEALAGKGPGHSAPVTLVDYDKDAEAKIVAAVLYQYSSVPMNQARQSVEGMSAGEKKKVLDAYVGSRRHRRDKPGRAWELPYYEFDILADFGAYRDLQRHRILTQMRQDLTVEHGFDIPQEIVEAGLKEEFESCMRAAAELWRKLRPIHPKEAQYMVPFAYRVRWLMKLNLREASHMIELRTTKQGHPSYRKICQLMYQEIQRVHPFLSSQFKFVDMNDYSLGRMDSEMRTEEKRETLRK